MLVLHITALPMQVEWNNNRDPTKGFKYLFLSDADYTSIAARADTAVLKADPFFAENGVYILPLSTNQKSIFTRGRGAHSTDEADICASASAVSSQPIGKITGLR